MKSKEWSLGRLYIRWGDSEFDFARRVGTYLLELPICTSRVVLVSPNYGEQHYRCELIVNTSDLQPWAEQYAQAVWSYDNEEQAARKALPIWLRSAQLGDPSLSYLPHYFYKVVRMYLTDFINKNLLTVICSECGEVVQEILMKKLNERRELFWSCWTDEWYCPKGHMLYREDHGLKIFCEH